MSDTNIEERQAQTRVYSTQAGQAVIEQSNGAAVTLSAEQILTVIKELKVCYDYCAVWKDPTRG